MNHRMRRQMARSRRTLNAMNRRPARPTPEPSATPTAPAEPTTLTDDQVADVLEHDVNKLRRDDRSA